jgi:hypothetical protein
LLLVLERNGARLQVPFDPVERNAVVAFDMDRVFLNVESALSNRAARDIDRRDRRSIA